MAKNNVINVAATVNADGFDLTGGTTSRTLTVTGGNATLSGGGSAVISFPSATGTLSTLSLEENIPLVIDVVLSADGKYSGIVVDGTAGSSALAFGDLVYLDSAGPDWELADASAASTSGTPKLGICVLAASSAAATKILVYGAVRADAVFPTFTAGQIFVSETAGDVTSTAPTTTDSVTRVLGHALTSDSMFFNPDNYYSTHV